MVFCKNVLLIYSQKYLIIHSIVAVARIQTEKERIIEGELRCTQLVKHLERTGSSMDVFLSEDASGVVRKVVYDSHTNQMIGLVLPFNATNGMPELFSFQATSAEAIKSYMELPQSTLVYIVVAQPLKKKTPPFILQIFGSINKFETSDVLKRWEYTLKELKRYDELDLSKFIYVN